MTEEVAVDLELRQRVAQLPYGRRRGLVDQHLLWSCVGGDVVHEGHALVEEVSPPALEIASHPVVADALPFEAGDELAGYGVKVLEQERVGLDRRLLH